MLDVLDSAYLREQATKCMRIAGLLTDDDLQTKTALLQIAAYFFRWANRLDGKLARRKTNGGE